MRRRVAAIVAAWWVVATIGTLALAETDEPREVPPEICDLAVLADPINGTVTVTWSGGAPPFTVVRSEAEDLSGAQRLEVLASAVPTSQFVDRSVDLAKPRLFYQIFDVNSQPRIFDLSPNAALPGSQVHVRGIGFPSDCTRIEATLGGTNVSAKHDCSFTGFTFEVPQGSVTGYLMVVTPSGATVSGAPYEGEYCHGQPEPPKSW